MQAEPFYQSSRQDTIPLFFIHNTDHLSTHDMVCATAQQFKSQMGECCLVHNTKGNLQKIIIGLGESADEAIALAVHRLPPGCYSTDHPLSQTARLLWSLAQYQFDRYKKNSKPPRVLALSPDHFSSVLTEAKAIFLVRDLINTPTNDMGPEDMANVLSSLANTHQATFQQWVSEALLEHGFPAVHAVGRASATPPRLLSLTWGDISHPKVALVGKGVCFDSGGLDLKPSSGMRLMKKDMGGAAQVIGLASLIMTRKIPIHLHVLIPAVENAVSSNAYRPGDVLTMRNGLTVEIDNTDAEGRLIVADALVKACEQNPELLIDFTTLTGAARVAVGTEISALFTNSDDLAESLMDAANTTSDPIWRMPLFSNYDAMNESSIADLSNSSSSSYAGAITAALFLQHFVNPGTTWAHFDIMAWNIKSKPGKPEGGEAMGLRAVAAYLMTQYGVGA